MRLSEEQQIALKEIQAHPGYRVVLLHLEEAVRLMEREVLEYDLANGSDAELVRRKCRHEGAKRLFNAAKIRIGQSSSSMTGARKPHKRVVT